MKKWILVTLLLLVTSLARAEVPHLINLQSMIYDMDGNVSTEEFVDITVRILDADGNILYTEDHPSTPLAEGAVNLSIGSANGPLPLEVMDPSNGTKFLDILVDGTTPYELMPLTAVPYAMWAEKALTVADDSIESRHIKDGAITLKDLAPGIAFSDITGEANDTQLPQALTRDTELVNHIEAVTAHPASAITLAGNFMSFVASDVQMALEKIDSRIADEIVNRQTKNTTLQNNLNTETTARQNADTTLQNNLTAETNARTSADTTLQNNINAEAASRATGDTTLQSNITSEASTRAGDDTTLQGNINTVSGALSSHTQNISNPHSVTYTQVGAASSEHNHDLSYASAGHNHDSSYASAAHNHDSSYVDVGGDTMTGNLAFENGGSTKLRIYYETGNITTSGTVDGINISSHAHGNSTGGTSLYGNAIWSSAGSANDDTYTASPPSNFNMGEAGGLRCGITVGLTSFEIEDGIDILCIKYCRDTDNRKFRIRCLSSSSSAEVAGTAACDSYFDDGNDGDDPGSSCDLKSGAPGYEGCRVSYRILCYD